MRLALSSRGEDTADRGDGSHATRDGGGGYSIQSRCTSKKRILVEELVNPLSALQRAPRHLHQHTFPSIRGARPARRMEERAGGAAAAANFFFAGF